MESQTPKPHSTSFLPEQPAANMPSSTSPEGHFQPGTTVIYPLHGKCTVLGIEEKKIGSESIVFYKLEVQKSSFSRSVRQEPAIWVPVKTAHERGMRLPMNRDQLTPVMATLSDREHYFNVHLSWPAAMHSMETAIRAEGPIGLAKAASYLHVLKKRQVVPTSDVAKFSDSVLRQLTREISEISGESIKEVESKVTKALRHKLIPDT